MNRRLALVVALIVLAVVAFVVMVNARETPVATRAGQPQGTVLLIPGYGGAVESLQPLASALERDGIATQIVPIGDGEGDLAAYALEVEAYARGLVSAGQPAPDLVGFSAGGVIARIAATRDPELYRKVITLGSPHQGTSTANLGDLVGQCPLACQQMRPDSELLGGLPEPKYVNDWLSVWSETDATIRPPSSSELPIPNNYRLQEFCPGPVEHGSLPGDVRVISAIIAFLKGAPLPTGCPTVW